MEMNIVIIKNDKFTRVEEKIYKCLEKIMNIKTIKDTKILDTENVVFSYKKLHSKYKTLSHMAELIYILLSEISCEYKRLDMLKNIFMNEDVVILAAGPYLDTSKLRYIIDNYITISVKYTVKYLFEHNMIPTFIVFNQWLAIGSNVDDYNNYTNRIVSIYGKLDKISKSYGLINFVSTSTHTSTFDEISKHIDKFSWKPNELSYNCAHIMLELAIPLSMHIGSKNIYTLGWDLDYKNGYFTKDIKNQQEDFSILFNKSESHIVKDVVIILKKYGINIYKINKSSPINLEYKDIL